MGSRTELMSLAGTEAASTAEAADESADAVAIHETMLSRVSGGEEISGYFTQHHHWQRGVAALLLLASLPVIGLALLLVRCTSRGPVLYRQTRIGLRGRTFQLIKIRTMRLDAEATTGPVWTTSLNDDRITKVGRVLRWTHIDELPQLWNVLREEMALVGPRPERPEFIEMLVQSVPGYLDRLAVLPGITGLAQINLPADEDTESVRRKLVLDRRYIREGSANVDLRIMVCTAIRLLGIRSLWLRRLLHVACEVPAAVPPELLRSGAGPIGLSGHACSLQPAVNKGDGTQLVTQISDVMDESCFVELTEPSARLRHSSR